MTMLLLLSSTRLLRSAGAAGATLVLAACSASPSAPAAIVEARSAAPDVVVLSDTARQHAGITVEPVRSVTRSEQLTAPGWMALDETRTARIGSLQEGLVLETLAQVGDRVRAGQLLANMHGHAVHDAWAGYRKATADRRRLTKELAYAIDAHERAARLYRDKAISLQDLQRAEVERVSAKEMLDMGEAEVRRSIEELEHIGIIISDEAGASGEDMPESTEQIPVKSPIRGVVLERLVTPGTTVIPGSPLFVVSELSTLWAIAEIDETLLAHVRIGRPVEVRVAAYPNDVFRGTITFIADLVNPKTRRITVRSVVPNASGRLKPEMFATIRLGESDSREMAVVPRDAIHAVHGRTSVFVEESDGRFRVRPVEVGSERDGLVAITSGVTPDERIAVEGSFVIKSELLRTAGSEE